MADQRNFWAHVRSMWQTMDESKPDGRRAVVRVKLRDGDSFVPGVVGPADDFVVFQTIDDARQNKVIAVPPHEIARVDIEYEEGDKAPVGFTVGDVE